MGTTAHVVIEGGASDLLDWSQDRLWELHNAWTRFDDNSELSKLNRGDISFVSPDTARLMAVSRMGFHYTRGRFNPYQARTIADLGYDRDFAELADQTPSHELTRAHGAQPGGRNLDPLVGRQYGRFRAQLPKGFELDSGGIGKGYAADLVSRELLDRGAQAVLVNLGGDLRVRGNPMKGYWEVEIDDDTGRREPLSIKLTGGALATSSTQRRRWQSAGQEHHHLIDPVTRQSLASPYVACTAIAPSGWLAEVLSKASFLLPPNSLEPLLRRKRAVVLLQAVDGQLTQLPN